MNTLLDEVIYETYGEWPGSLMSEDKKPTCELWWKVEYFPPGGYNLTKAQKKDIQDIFNNRYKEFKVRLGRQGKKLEDIIKSVKLDILTMGFVDVHPGSDPVNHEEGLDSIRASNVLDAFHALAMLKGVPRRNIETDYRGEGQFSPRNLESGKNRMVKVCLRWRL